MVRSTEGRAIGVWERDDTVRIKVGIVQSQLPLGTARSRRRVRPNNALSATHLFGHSEHSARSDAEHVATGFFSPPYDQRRQRHECLVQASGVQTIYPYPACVLAHV